MKKIVTGIVAHVDAGKTTLSEALLYSTGAIRKLGRVDHGSAFLDTDSQERARGITIFSKQAVMEWGDTQILLLDTPGHVDFSAEMERTLQVLDYAILVISGKDGVQGHTVTLWKLLERYGIPAFIFVNKMDLDTADKAAVEADIKHKLSESCVEFEGDYLAREETAAQSEVLIEEFLERGTLSEKNVADSIRNRELFPCFYGSALKMDGVDRLLENFDRYTQERDYSSEFGARVYKITRDDRGARLTHMKITGGRIKAKEMVNGEKVDQIRVCSGEKFRMSDCAEAGDVVAVTGLERTEAGQGLGCESGNFSAVLEPAMIYDVIMADEYDAHTVLSRMRVLEEEDPQLHVTWNEKLRKVQVQLMGEIQLEILRQVISDRFGMELEFGTGHVAYKETITKPVIGGGHFEPLRHYAEVQLLMEPASRGSGIITDSICSEDVLDRNWQRLIMTHLTEREHPGVLTGSGITDIKISIAAGRAHDKHTEGGDFRQAVYRAIRQGLMKTECQLLEPWYSFVLEVPQETVGTAMADVQRMGGEFSMPETDGEMSVLRGRAPVVEMKEYAARVTSYTRGRGRLACTLNGYDVCHNQEEVLAQSDYNPERDIDNPADSVFCSHGAGYNVKWDQVDEMLHTRVNLGSSSSDGANSRPAVQRRPVREYSDEDFSGPAFVHAPEPSRRREYAAPKIIDADRKPQKTREQVVLPEYVLVDGYNIIFAWDELKELAQINIDAARDALIEMMQNYQGYKMCRLILVFDAYRIKGGERRVEERGNITVVFTKEKETADAFIEKTSYELGGKYMVRVATSDRMEQMIIIGNGAFKISADEFKKEVQMTNEKIDGLLEEYKKRNREITGRRIIIKDDSE